MGFQRNVSQRIDLDNPNYLVLISAHSWSRSSPLKSWRRTPVSLRRSGCWWGRSWTCTCRRPSSQSASSARRRPMHYSGEWNKILFAISFLADNGKHKEKVRLGYSVIAWVNAMVYLSGAQSSSWLGKNSWWANNALKKRWWVKKSVIISHCAK